MMFGHLKRHWRLLVILLIYLMIAVAHSLLAPLTIGNDEWAHFLYIRFIADHGRLPVNLAERSNREEVGYKSDDPPLYHLLAAAATAGIEPTRLLRPINSPQRQLADTIVYPYEFIVHTGPELFPYRGEVLVWHLARGLSILFGMFMLGLTYLTGLELGLGRRRALVAAALLAFMPAVIFHTSVVSYESLSAAFSALFLLVGIKTIKQPQGWLGWVALGVLAGLSITTKYSAVLLPLEIGFITWLAAARGRVSRSQDGELTGQVSGYRRGYPTALFASSPALPTWPVLLPALKRMFMAGLATLLALSWWFGFTLWHFNTVETKGWVVGVLEPLMVRGANDSTAVNVAALFFGAEDVSADLSPPRLERNYGQLVRMMIDSFWAAPIAGKYILSPWLPLLFSLVLFLGVIGLGPVWQQTEAIARSWFMLLIFHTLLITPLLVIRVFLSFDPREVAQGRHFLMPAASAIAILLVWGWEQWSGKIGQRVVVGLLVWSVAGQLGWAAVTYSPPIPVWTKQAPPEAGQAQATPLTATFAGAMQLTGVSWRETAAASLEVTLWWQALAVMAEDYLIELTLLDRAGQVASYTLGQPGQGRYPTRAWEPGDVIRDSYGLPLTGQTPGSYQLQLRLLTHQGQPLAEDQSLLLGQVSLIGSAAKTPDPCTVWYQGRPDPGHLLASAYHQGSTLTVLRPDLPELLAPPGESDKANQKPFVSKASMHVFMVGPDWSGRYQLLNGTARCRDIWVETPPRSFNLPEMTHRLEANFNQQVQLLGYELPTRRIQPGGRLPLTLYWQALAYMGEDYHIFDNLLDREQRRWGGYDRRPRDGYSTLLWAPGEVITDAFGVPVDPNAPDDIYTLDIGLYREVAGQALSLPLVQAGQPLDGHSLRLGPIKVGGPPPGTTIRNPTPQIMLNQALGNQITLLGYDLIEPKEHPDQSSTDLPAQLNPPHLKLTLYWRADTVPEADYTTFLHLRNEANQIVTQQDSPPTGGRYPTSLWEVGEIIVDEISLPLTNVPAGHYTPVLGLYNLTNAERLTVLGHPANEIALEPVHIP